MNCKLISVNEITLAQEKENKISQHFRPWLLCRLFTTTPMHNPSDWTLEGPSGTCCPFDATTLADSSQIWTCFTNISRPLMQGHQIHAATQNNMEFKKKNIIKKIHTSDTTVHRIDNKTPYFTPRTNIFLLMKNEYI
jgi:hypothetical protein